MEWGSQAAAFVATNSIAVLAEAVDGSHKFLKALPDMEYMTD